MRRAYFLITIPPALVGLAYVILLHYLGVPINAGPFLGTALAAVLAVLIVRRYQKRKTRRHGNS